MKSAYISNLLTGCLFAAALGFAVVTVGCDSDSDDGKTDGGTSDAATGGAAGTGGGDNGTGGVAGTGGGDNSTGGAAGTGGGENGDEIDQLFEEHATQGTASRDKACTCASDLNGDWCKNEPEKCYQTKDECLESYGKDEPAILWPLSKDTISCLKQEMSASLDALKALATCYKDTATTFNKCLGGSCTTESFGCADAVEHAPCMETTFTNEVQTAMDKCTKSGK